MNVSERIKSIRKDNRLSQVAFGEKLGTSRDVISNIEIGRVAPNGVILNLICSTFSVSKEWLLNGTGEMYALSKDDDELMEAIAQISLSDNEKLKRIVSNLMKLDEQYIDSINTIIDGLVKK